MSLLHGPPRECIGLSLQDSRWPQDSLVICYLSPFPAVPHAGRKARLNRSTTTARTSEIKILGPTALVGLEFQMTPAVWDLGGRDQDRTARGGLGRLGAFGSVQRCTEGLRLQASAGAVAASESLSLSMLP